MRGTATSPAVRASREVEDELSCFSRLVQALYEDLDTNDSWGAFLSELAEAIPATYYAFGAGVLPAHSRNLDFPYSSFGPRQHRARVVDPTPYASFDPFVGLPEGQPVTLREFIPAARLERNPFFKDYLEVIDLVHVLGIDLCLPGTYEARLRILRSRAKGDFSASEKKTCEDLVPHLRVAARMHVRLDSLAAERSLYAEALRELTAAMVMLGSEGEVVHMTRIAERVLGRTAGITVVDRRLILDDAGEHECFAAMTARALDASRRSGPSMPEALRLARSCPDQEVWLTVRPLPVGTSPGPAFRVAVGLGGEPERPEACPEAVQKLLGLTRAEATIALALARGKSVKDAAREFSISISTARTHMRSIFRKTGINRQTELVRTVLQRISMIGCH